MGVTATLDTTGLDAVIGMLPRVAAARDEVAKLIAFDWAAGVEASETGTDQPGQRDYDENIFADENGPDETDCWTDIEWAVKREYGEQGDPGDGGQARQAAEAHREDFTNAVAAAVTG